MGAEDQTWGLGQVRHVPQAFELQPNGPFKWTLINNPPLSLERSKQLSGRMRNPIPSLALSCWWDVGPGGGQLQRIYQL